MNAFSCYRRKEDATNPPPSSLGLMQGFKPIEESMGQLFKW